MAVQFVGGPGVSVKPCGSAVRFKNIRLAPGERRRFDAPGRALWFTDPPTAGIDQLRLEVEEEAGISIVDNRLMVVPGFFFKYFYLHNVTGFFTLTGIGVIVLPDDDYVLWGT
jgi:hypothetical protein